MRIERYITLLLLAMGGGAVAQERLSLARYQEQVVAYSQELKQRGEALLSAEAQERLAKKGFLPQLQAELLGTLDLNELEAWSGEADEYRNHTYLGEIKVSQPIWSGGAIRNRYRATKIETKQAHLAKELSLQEVTYIATTTYWRGVANEELYLSAEEFVGIVKQQYDLVKARFEQGNIGKSDLLMIATQLKESELQLTIAQRVRTLARQQLNLLMGVNPDTLLLTAEDIYSYTPTPPLQATAMVVEQHPSYLSALLAIDLQERYRQVELAQYLPQVGLSVTGGWGTTTPNVGYKPDFSGMALLSVVIPIPYSGSRRESNQIAKAAIRTQEWQLSLVKDRLVGEVKGAHTQMIQSVEQIILANEGLELASENLKLSNYAYNEGRIPISDVLTAQLSWIQARTNTVSAQLAHKIAVAEYLRIVGLPAR